MVASASSARWSPGDRVVLDLAMPARFTLPDRHVDAVRGCVAVERGPLVYCLEEADLPPGIALADVSIDTSVVPGWATRPTRCSARYPSRSGWSRCRRHRTPGRTRSWSLPSQHGACHAAPGRHHPPLLRMVQPGRRRDARVDPGGQSLTRCNRMHTLDCALITVRSALDRMEDAKRQCGARIEGVGRCERSGTLEAVA